MARRARVFEPISSIAAGGGPIQTSPASSTARANAAFSARKPYPGCTASAPERSRGFEQLLDDQIGLGGGVAAEGQGLVGVERVRREPVDVGVDRHGADVHVTERPEDAESDLSAVGDQDFGEHTPYSPDR